MRAVVTLTPSESKRLIAKAVVRMPEVRKAWENAYLLLSDGTTNAFIAQELLQDRSISPSNSTVGLCTDGLLCVTRPSKRQPFPSVFYKGEVKNGRSFAEALSDYHKDTVVIKGANALDPNGFVGIVTTGFDGGTIPKIIGPVTSKGITMITPVGLEKLVPSVPAAAKALGGAGKIDISMGADGGMYCLTNTSVITEIEAIRLLFGAEAVLVACGGVGGNEGAVVLAVDGSGEQIPAMVEFLEQEVKGEPAINGNRGDCELCRYRSCRYCGRKEEELPEWMRGRRGE
ncbi:sugar phosphate isomerase family [Qiania dongpingensis]|uniref:Uncharacterized protein n=1 Tax=Qiania dongpingensis TaxID=2763669 RepID=A0A7G9G3N2_9FIRM|nr:hypothetical protein [Qiania dongpingensis]QNM05414.1 hypothetical protein H9Q78_13430 [Qiania dongpingensis]